MSSYHYSTDTSANDWKTTASFPPQPLTNPPPFSRRPCPLPLASANRISWNCSMPEAPSNKHFIAAVSASALLFFSASPFLTM